MIEVAEKKLLKTCERMTATAFDLGAKDVPEAANPAKCLQQLASTA